MIDFIIDYFAHLNARKAIGGILAVFGIGMLGQINGQSNANAGILFAIGGLIVGGIGFVIIYFDMANDKNGGNFDSMDTLTKAYKQEARENRKITTWHMDETPPKRDSSDSTGNQ